jgi:dihydroflavonol-4-reductase
MTEHWEKEARGVTCSSILVTGASGLLGSNICRLAANAGRRVRGLVRTAADAEVLCALGAEPAIGDITDPRSLRDAMKGIDGLIHSAAVLGGTWSSATPDDFDRVNYHGSLTVLDEARRHSIGRIVVISSKVIFSHKVTVTESSPLVFPGPGLAPYARAKLAVYYEGMHRVCRGEHITFVVPGAMYGPSPFTDRALQPTLFTGTLRNAIRGELTEYADFPLSWPYVEDAARVALAALDNGRAGGKYLAAGGPEDVLSLAGFCNLGCAVAGVSHRVRDVPLAELTSDIGPMRAMAERRYPTPLVDPSRTNDELGITLTPVRAGVERTVAWLRTQGRI